MQELFSQLVAELLWRSSAFKTSVEAPFQLASGNYSPIYVNCRALISDPVAMDVVACASHFLVRDREISVDCVAGGETAGIPFAAYVASRLNHPMLYVRKAAKEYGLSRQVEGSIAAGARVLLVEDLVTDGKSKLGFINALRAAGAAVENCLVVFDREQGATSTLAAEGVTLSALTSLGALLEAGARSGRLTPEARAEIEQHLRDPRAWHAARGLPFNP